MYENMVPTKMYQHFHSSDVVCVPLISINIRPHENYLKRV